MRKLLRWKVFVLLASLLFVACDGDDGINGLDGLTGKDGADGKHGADGAGVEALTRDGYFKLMMSGTFPGNVAFKDTVFCPFGRVDFPMSSMRRASESVENYYLERFASVNGFQNSLELEFGLPARTVNFIKVDFLSMVFLSDGNVLSYGVDRVVINDAVVKNFKYDVPTGKVSYEFTGRIPKSLVDFHGSGELPEDIQIQGEVSATVYEEIK